MAPSEQAIKLVARITALEILAQHFICLACDRDLGEVREYRKRVLEGYEKGRVRGFDPVMSDHLTAEAQNALSSIFDALIRKMEEEE
jgi:hypothetical protein